VNTGQAPDATAIPVTHQTAEEAFDSAACMDVVLVLPPVKTEVLLYLLLQKLRIWHYFLRVKKKEANVFSIWFPNGY
jgi:hypothetical protein